MTRTTAAPIMSQRKARATTVRDSAQHTIQLPSRYGSEASATESLDLRPGTANECATQGMAGVGGARNGGRQRSRRVRGTSALREKSNLAGTRDQQRDDEHRERDENENLRHARTKLHGYVPVPFVFAMAEIAVVIMGVIGGCGGGRRCRPVNVGAPGEYPRIRRH